MSVGTVVVCQARVESIPVGLVVKSCGGLETFSASVAVRVTTAPASSDLSPTAATATVVATSAAVSVVIGIMPSFLLLLLLQLPRLGTDQKRLGRS